MSVSEPLCLSHTEFVFRKVSKVDIYNSFLYSSVRETIINDKFTQTLSKTIKERFDRRSNGWIGRNTAIQYFEGSTYIDRFLLSVDIHTTYRKEYCYRYSMYERDKSQ